MKSIKSKIFLTVLALAAIGFAIAPILTVTGCATEKESVIATNEVVSTNAAGQLFTNPVVVTNVVTVVNEANLLIDTAALQGGATIVFSEIIQKDAGAIPDLKLAQAALTGVISGASTNSASQIVSALGQSSDTTLATSIQPLVQSISSAEQSLVAKYGSTVAGQVIIAVARSVNSALTISLAGH